MVIPGKFYPKKLYEWVKFWVKKFWIRERGLRFGLKNHKRPFWDVGRNFFFFVETKVEYSVSWGGIHWRLPWNCNRLNIISGLQSKFEKSEFFIVFSSFDRDPEIIM